MFRHNKTIDNFVSPNHHLHKQLHKYTSIGDFKWCLGKNWKSFATTQTKKQRSNYLNCIPGLAYILAMKVFAFIKSSIYVYIKYVDPKVGRFYGGFQLHLHIISITAFRYLKNTKQMKGKLKQNRNNIYETIGIPGVFADA